MPTLFNTILQSYYAGFRQACDATCGPASIILAAKGLGLEEKQEAEWSCATLAHWMPVDQFLVRGMALHELHFVSEFIYGQKVNIQLRRAYPENLGIFLNDIKDTFQQKNAVIIVNYRQNDFIFTTPCVAGNPHYSPMVKYSPKEDKVLIADVDPHVSEPYWVSIEALFQSMTYCSPVFHLPRGWLIVRKR